MNPAITNNLERTIRAQLLHEKRYLLGVSGGVDSMVLLHICAQLQAENYCSILVAHVNHGLRETAGRDQSLVAEYCGQREIPFFVTRADIPEGENVEAAARRARYAFFRQLLDGENCDYILTAHTASDVVETYLMRILSNKEPRTIAAVDEERMILRPMLSLFRQQILEYAQRFEVQFFDDESNFDTRFLRNRVRQSLLPFLAAEFNSGIEKLLLERALAAASDIEVLDTIASDYLLKLEEHRFGSKNWRRAFCELLNDLPEDLDWRLVELCLQPKLRFNLGRQHARRALAVIKGQVVAAELPGSIRIARRDGGILLEVNK